MLVLKKEGVILKPGSGFPVSDPIGSVMWKVSPDIAIEWEVSDPDVTYYGHFKGIFTPVQLHRVLKLNGTIVA